MSAAHDYQRPFEHASIFDHLLVRSAMAAEYIATGNNIDIALHAKPCDCLLGAAKAPLADDSRMAILLLSFRGVSLDCKAVKRTDKTNMMHFADHALSGGKHYGAAGREHLCTHASDLNYDFDAIEREHLKSCAWYDTYCSDATFNVDDDGTKPTLSVFCHSQFHYLQQGNVYHQDFLWDIRAERAYVSEVIYY